MTNPECLDCFYVSFLTVTTGKAQTMIYHLSAWQCKNSGKVGINFVKQVPQISSKQCPLYSLPVWVCPSCHLRLFLLLNNNMAMYGNYQTCNWTWEEFHIELSCYLFNLEVLCECLMVIFYFQAQCGFASLNSLYYV